MKEINSIKREVIQIEAKEKEDNNDKLDVQPRTSLPAGSSHGVTKLVGLDDDFKEIKSRLDSGSLQLEIVALVGMGGIGKTTLAKKVYDDKSIVSHFDTRRWATVSQKYSLRSILIELLGRDAMSEKNNEDLKLDLYQSLKKRRYLIVLDDMWDTNVWDGLKRVLPNDKNESRILLTTRLEKVAKHENSSPKHMRLLDKKESWVLFCDKVFGGDCCPPELEEVGREIVAACRGLPLALNVIGEHLSKATTRSEHYWKSVSENLCEKIASEDDEHCSRVLSLSYKHLSHRLKGCFLYLGIFPEDYVIKVSRLLHLWIATGLIKQEKSKSFEDIAKEYFLDLVERNFILIPKLKYNGKINRCKIHDLIRDLCVKEAKIEMFFPLTSRTFDQSCYCEVDRAADPYRWHLRASYMRGSNKWNDAFFRDLLTMVNLRYLYYYDKTFCCYGVKPFESMHKLRHLHTIHFYHPFIVNIWEMPQLRHVKTRRDRVLPNLPTSEAEGGDSVIVLEKLQTLEILENLILTDEVLRRIPNIKKLGLCYYKCNDEGGDDKAIDLRDFGLNNLERLHKLESILCHFQNVPPIALNRDITFPHSIKKLTLNGSRAPWEQMTVVGSLRNLQVLKLETNSFVGEEWEPTEGEFLNLKTLCLHNLEDLVHWRAVANHFPALQHLSIRCCENLPEIPSCFGEILTLQLIVLDKCKERILSSARKIEEEQHEYGNEGFQVQIIG